MKIRTLKIHLSNFPRTLANRQHPLFEFHVHINLRKKYQVDESLFSSSGNVIFPNYHAVRLLAHRMNSHATCNRTPN
jgi:hypothetical protein